VAVGRAVGALGELGRGVFAAAEEPQQQAPGHDGHLGDGTLHRLESGFSRPLPGVQRARPTSSGPSRSSARHAYQVAHRLRKSPGGDAFSETARAWPFRRAGPALARSGEPTARGTRSPKPPTAWGTC